MAVRRRSTRSLAKPATPCDLSQIDHTAEALGEFDLPDRHATSCLPRSYRSGTGPITGRGRGRSGPMVCRRELQYIPPKLDGARLTLEQSGCVVVIPGDASTRLQRNSPWPKRRGIGFWHTSPGDEGNEWQLTTRLGSS